MTSNLLYHFRVDDERQDSNRGWFDLAEAVYCLKVIVQQRHYYFHWIVSADDGDVDGCALCQQNVNDAVAFD